MKKYPFYKLVSRVTVDGKELKTDQTNPYINENWFANEPKKQEKKMPTGHTKLKTSNTALERRRRQIVEMVRRQPMTQSQIEAQLGYARGGSYVMLHDLKKAGRLAKSGSFWIAAPDTAPDTKPEVKHDYFSGQPSAGAVAQRERRVAEAIQATRSVQAESLLTHNAMVLTNKIEELAKQFVWETELAIVPSTIKAFVNWLRSQNK